VTSKTSLTRSGWAIIVLAAAALALGGCGRKGPLDLPPTASNATPTAQATGDTETERASQPSVFNSTFGSDAAPTAAKGNKKPFILDPLLGN
jgi:predicted small lipoprotein YifL